MNLSFQKQEKLKHKKLIDQLFKEGKSVSKFPLRLVYLKINHLGDKPLQAGFSVPKRNFKRAVDRNLLKRRMREAYRLNKEIVYKELNDKCILMFIYLDKKRHTSAEIHPKMRQLLQKFMSEILKN